MSAYVVRSGFEQRLAMLRAQRASLDGQIAEVEWWIEFCAGLEAEAPAEAPPVEPVKGRRRG